MAVRGHGEIRAHQQEQEQRYDLEGQAGDHDVDTRLLAGVGARGRGQGAADGLEDEREEIETHKGNSVDGGAETWDAAAVDDHDAGEAEVDGSTEQGGADGEADEISA